MFWNLPDRTRFIVFSYTTAGNQDWEDNDMGITEQEAIKELQTRDEIFVAYSQATKLPYVICDQESFNDQVWVFATEEEIKALGKKKLEDKILLILNNYYE